ncbi:MAG: hypothetical protein J2P25_20270 [Nocardiopsaceae bacterium]|nr:hypothetical protein [Nocardiopsaceae bacterium]
MALIGIGALVGLIKQAPAGSRWHAPRLVGTADVALGAWLLLYGLLWNHPWGVLISVVCFAVGAICMVTWLIKAAGRKADDEFDSGRPL